MTSIEQLAWSRTSATPHDPDTAQLIARYVVDQVEPEVDNRFLVEQERGRDSFGGYCVQLGKPKPGEALWLGQLSDNLIGAAPGVALAYSVVLFPFLDGAPPPPSSGLEMQWWTVSREDGRTQVWNTGSWDEWAIYDHVVSPAKLFRGGASPMMRKALLRLGIHI